MFQDFLEKTLNLIRKSNFRLLIPQIREINLSQNGTRTIYIAIEDSVSSISIDFENNPILLSMITFSLIDTFIDLKYPQLEGLSFKRKYEKLDHNVLREIYRILKLLRNAVVHMKSAVEFKDDSCVISYTWKNTSFYLELNKIAYRTLITLAFILIKVQVENIYHFKYIQALIHSYYNEIRKSIKIQDEFGDNLESISYDITLNFSPIRYQVKNPSIKEEYGTLIIEIVDNDISRFADYVIRLNGKDYLIPNEALKADRIAISELPDWTYLELRKIFSMNFDGGENGIPR